MNESRCWTDPRTPSRTRRSFPFGYDLWQLISIGRISISFAYAGNRLSDHLHMGVRQLNRICDRNQSRSCGVPAGRTTVYELVKAKRLHEVHIGRAGRFTGAELERFAAQLDAESKQRAPRTPGRRRDRHRTPTDPDGLFDLPAS